MARKPAPTKANLFQAKHDLHFAMEGCELLHQKRDVLVMELMAVTAAFSDTENKLRENLLRTLDIFTSAYLMYGREGMNRAYPEGCEEISLGIEEHGIMGIPVPEITVESGGETIFTGLMDSSSAMDSSVSGMVDVLENLTSYVQTVSTIWRLATEIEKTQRRINAIENNFIPESRETVKWIKSVMEENDREELFRRKLLKNRTLQTGDDNGRKHV